MRKVVPRAADLIPDGGSDWAVMKKMPWSLEGAGTCEAVTMCRPVLSEVASGKSTMKKFPDEIADSVIAARVPDHSPDPVRRWGTIGIEQQCPWEGTIRVSGYIRQE